MDELELINVNERKYVTRVARGVQISVQKSSK